MFLSCVFLFTSKRDLFRVVRFILLAMDSINNTLWSFNCNVVEKRFVFLIHTQSNLPTEYHNSQGILWLVKTVQKAAL